MSIGLWIALFVFLLWPMTPTTVNVRYLGPGDDEP